MNETLKMKPSVFLIISRIVAAVLVLLLIGMAFFGIFDFRTEEQKIADFKEKLVTDSYAQAALKGLRSAYRQGGDITPERVSVFRESGLLYVAVAAKNVAGESVAFFYNATSNKSISARDYTTACRDPLLGVTNYEDLELRVLCEEV